MLLSLLVFLAAVKVSSGSLSRGPKALSSNMGLAWMPAKRIWGKTNLGVMASCRKPLRRKRAKAQSLRRQAVKDGLAPKARKKLRHLRRGTLQGQEGC